MIVCLCKGVSDRKIREMAQEGLNLSQIVSTCEASTCCGACAQSVEEIVLGEHSAKTSNSKSRINPQS